MQDRNCPFALKVFKERENVTQAAEREQNMLKELALFPHPHIVPHLAGWTQGKKFYILYPLASQNLREFMHLTKRPRLTAEKVKWFLVQLRGLADALRHVHFLGSRTSAGPAGTNYLSPNEPTSEATTARLIGYHHDIKPENILVFPYPRGQGTILKISDFGAGKFGLLPHGAKSNLVTNPKGTITYEGPDRLYNEGKGASRPFDVWALACVFLELLSWLFMPYDDAILNFASDRARSQDNVLEDDRFWCYVRDEHGKGHCQLKQSVVDRLNSLSKNHCKNLRAFEELIGIIRKLFEMDPEKRMKASALFDAIDAIVKQTERDLEENETLYTDPKTPPPQTAFADAKSTVDITENLQHVDEMSGTSNRTGSPRPDDLVGSGTGIEDRAQDHTPNSTVQEEEQIALEGDRITSATTDSSSHVGYRRSEPAERERPVANVAAVFRDATTNAAKG